MAFARALPREKPSRANRMLGRNSSFHASLPWRLCASSYPRISPGTAMASPPAIWNHTDTHTQLRTAHLPYGDTHTHTHTHTAQHIRDTGLGFSSELMNYSPHTQHTLTHPPNTHTTHNTSHTQHTLTRNTLPL